MSLKTRIVAIFVILFCLLGATVFVMSLLAQNSRQMVINEQQHTRALELADQLRQSSADLTRMVRTYAVTGDIRFERYFNHILAIREGKAPRPENYHKVYWDFIIAEDMEPPTTGERVSLRELMEEINLTNEEKSLLAKAKSNSDTLVKLEKIAFAAMKGIFANSRGELIVRQTPDPALAKNILHGEEYHREKALIMEPINEFINLVDRRFQREIEDIRVQALGLQNTVIALVVVTLGFSFFSFFCLKVFRLVAIYSKRLFVLLDSKKNHFQVI